MRTSLMLLGSDGDSTRQFRPQRLIGKLPPRRPVLRYLAQKPEKVVGQSSSGKPRQNEHQGLGSPWKTEHPLLQQADFAAREDDPAPRLGISTPQPHQRLPAPLAITNRIG